MVNDYPAYIECNDLNGNIQDIIRQAFDSLYFQILIDRTGRIVYINDSYADFFGRTKQDIIGRQIEEIIPNTKLYDVIETGTPKIDELFEFVDGRHLVYSRLPIRNSYGEIQGVITASSFNTSKQLDDLRANIDELLRSNTILTRQLYGLDQAPAVFSSIVGNSPKIKELKHTLSKVCNSTMPILLTGESGTGKEVFATAIHNASARKNAPFIKVNCAALPRELVESELFGYETGTFSGAIKGGKAGKFEMANHGTILLDEVEELPLEAQSKLLRVLQEYEVDRIGSATPIPLDIHVICCSNQDLYEMVKEKKFREDLLYRINVMEIEIPPLRERKEDIEGLCYSIISSINKQHKLEIENITKTAVAYLSEYAWPGNIRELVHVLERACILTDSQTLHRKDFLFMEEKKQRFTASQIALEPDTPAASPLPAVPAVPAAADIDFAASRDQFEKQTIEEALARCGGNKTKAARALGISRSLLYDKINKYSI